jgi:hypothetical protein
MWREKLLKIRHDPYSSLQQLLRFRFSALNFQFANDDELIRRCFTSQGNLGEVVPKRTIVAQHQLINEWTMI